MLKSIKNINLKNTRIYQELEPKINALIKKWKELLPREKYLLIFMVLCIVFSVFYISINALINYRKHLEQDVNNLNNLAIYSQGTRLQYKKLSKIEAAKYTPVTTELIAQDIKQTTGIESPVITLQDQQLTVNINNVQFSLLILLLDQLRRSYNIYPDQLNINKQPQGGFVNVNAVFWINQ